MSGPAGGTERATVLALHHDYRVAGGEERAAEQLAALAESRLGEHVAWLRRDSTKLSGTDAARGLIGGGTGSRQVRDAVERTGADLLHAHNLFPTFGPAALRAARKAGAAVVVHLHNYRLACAVGVAVRDGRDCTQCSTRWTMPGVVHRCRGSVAESVAYAASLTYWQHEVLELADVIIVPSVAARTRLREFGLRMQADRVHIVGGVAEEIVDASRAAAGRYALVVTRLAAEKDVETAIEACRISGVRLVIAGDGPERERLEALAAADAGASGAPAGGRHGGRSRGGSAEPWSAADLAVLGEEAFDALDVLPVVRGNTIFVGRVAGDELAALRRGASVGLALSRAHETFGLTALESMAAGVPTIGSAVGALPELLGDGMVVPPGDASALALKITEVAGSEAAGLAAAERARDAASPQVVAARLAAAYAAARDQLAYRNSYG